MSARSRQLCELAQTACSIALILLAHAVVSAERLPLKTYTTADGLPHNIINKIVRDSRGFIWFCTFEGLSRFDGYTFTNYGIEDGLPSPVINDLLETREGDYWVATDAGLCRFNPNGAPRLRATTGASNNTATKTENSSPMFTAFFPADDLKSNAIAVLFQDHAGAIWCGTRRGLYLLNRQDAQVTFSFVELGMPPVLGEGNNITSIIEDRRGQLWIGSVSGIYRRFANGSVEHFDTHNGLPTLTVRSMLEDREGSIWVGTAEDGLVRLVPEPTATRSVVARVYSTKDGVPNWINQLLQDADGTLWAGSNFGLMRVSPTADGDFRFRLYAEANGFNSNQVQALTEDGNGNLWVGMANGGAAKLSRSGITSFGDADGFDSATALFKDRAGELFVVGVLRREGLRLLEENRINRFDGERLVPTQVSLPKNTTWGWGWNQLVLEDHLGEWWMATANGLLRFPRVQSVNQLARTPPKAIYTTRDGLASDLILRVFEDSRGDIWAGVVNGPGGQHGLSRWDRATEKFHHYTEADGLPALNNVYPISFAEDRTGAVWIGFSIGGGLVRYRNGRFDRFSTSDGLPEGGIFNLFVDSAGRLWTPTTRGGVSRIDHPEADKPQFTTYTTANGLSSNDVKAITEDRRQRIYLAAGRGIDRLDLTNGQIRHYTANEGAPLGNANAALQDRDGALWFSYATGLIRLIPEPDLPPVPAPVVITGLRVAGSARSISALGEKQITVPDLNANQNTIEISYVGLSFAAGDTIRYQFKLGDANWSEPTDQRFVNFANLAPHSYRFMVRAVNSNGVVSGEPAVVSFTILPPFYLRWWFIALVALIISVLAYAVYRYRITRLLEVANMRTRIATDLHDDIGANLTRISILSEVAKQRFGTDHQDPLNPLTSVAEIARESVASMSDIVWAIDPKRDSLRDLVRKMRQHADEVFTLRDIDLEFHAPDPDLDLKLGVDIRRDLLLIFKEAVNNAACHSHCSRAVIDFTADNHQLSLRIADNGSGFDPTLESAGQGLMSMRRRAKKLNGSFQIDSSTGMGTTITVSLPLMRLARISRAAWY